MMFRSVVFLALLALSACSRSTPATGPFCYEVQPGDRGGVNPLIGKVVHCYDERAACDKKHANDPDAIGPCAAPARVAWHCSSFPIEKPGADPLEGVADCLPSQALCEAARSPMATACTPAAAAVACSTSELGALHCYGDLTGCERTRDMLNRVMPPGPGPCALRR
jgi:hypothetical protein